MTIKNRPIPRITMGNNRPLVSIVTPSFNMARFLEETIQSVLSQDYPHIEYIVMDGSSTDGTVEILKRYRGRLRFESQRDQGQSDALNRGFAHSSGHILAFLNADDTYLPGAVGKAVGHMVSNPSAGAVYGEAYHVLENGQIWKRYPTLPFDFQMLNITCFVCQPATFMRREAFDAVGRMNVDLHFALDYDLWIRIARVYPMLKVNEVLATSRLHSQNKTMSQRREVYRETLKVVKTHFGYVPYSWLYGYASYLMDRKEQIFEHSPPSPAKRALSFFLGACYNPAQFSRYRREWAMGTPGPPTGRWEDGWISKYYAERYPVGENCQGIRILGRHAAPFRAGLRLDIRLEGALLKTVWIKEKGFFAVEMECPGHARGKSQNLEIRANKTFRPTEHGDYRRLSCIIDAVIFEDTPEPG